MEVTIRFSGPLRTLAGHASMTLSPADGATLHDLLHMLRETLPAPFVEQVLTPLEVNDGPLALILVNRKHPRDRADLERPLADGDVVAFVPPMAGG
jgi:molybdopterin converting factor small subunit